MHPLVLTYRHRATKLPPRPTIPLLPLRVNLLQKLLRQLRQGRKPGHRLELGLQLDGWSWMA